MTEESGKTFISHASEDKPFVKNLADTLIRYGIETWYDDYEIDLGDSIRGRINEGLSASKYGVVVLSHNFFNKKWPKAELASLAGILEEGRLLPVFHDISVDEVGQYDALLRDIKGVKAEGNARRVAAAVAKKVLGKNAVSKGGPAIYRNATISISRLPLSEDQCLQDMLFEDCVLQGLAVLTLHEDCKFEQVTFNGPEVFLAVPRGTALVGTYGVRRVSFRRVRFKDIGFTVTPEEYQAAMRSMGRAPLNFQFPPHLQ
ncbi:toll/interleukin-1 receptor domain-containing protein [Kineococcus gynurae]|uniref:Toll/interleukin-1 receptor domain-containing protein n=1 Tax=Kineococcus gynurae TaxID=452979 RepID=A0ABV5LU44_9ACTN